MSVVGFSSILDGTLDFGNEAALGVKLPVTGGIKLDTRIFFGSAHGLERMHLTLKKEATKPAAGNLLQQQARFEKFIEVFNHERLHEALDNKTIVVTRCGARLSGPEENQF